MALSVAPNPQDIKNLANVYYEYFTTQYGFHQLETMTEFLVVVLSHPDKDAVKEILWGESMKNVEEIIRLGKSFPKEERIYIHQLLNAYKNIIQKMSKSDPSIDKFLKSYFGSKIENKQYGGGILGLAAKLALVLTLFDTTLKTTEIFHPTTDGSSGVLNEFGQQGISGFAERALDSMSASWLGSEDAAKRSNYVQSDAFQAATLLESVETKTPADIVFRERYQTLVELNKENLLISATETKDAISYFTLDQIKDAEKKLVKQEQVVQTILNTPPTSSWGFFTKEFMNATSAIQNNPTYNVFFPNNASIKPSNVPIKSSTSENINKRFDLYKEIKNQVTRTHIEETLQGIYQITNATQARSPGALYQLVTATNSSMVANKTAITSAYEKGISLIQETNMKMDPIERSVFSRYTVNLISKPEKIYKRYDITEFQTQIEAALSQFNLTSQDREIVYYSLMTEATNVVNTNINMELSGIEKYTVIQKIKAEEQRFTVQLDHIETYVRKRYGDAYNNAQQTQIINAVTKGLKNLHDARLEIKSIEKLEGVIDILAPQILDGTVHYEARKTVFMPLSRMQKSTHAKLTEAFRGFQFSLLVNSAIAGGVTLLLSAKDIVSGILSIKIDWTIGKNASANVPKLENKKENTKANVPKLENKKANTATNARKPANTKANVPTNVPKPANTIGVECNKEKPCPEGKLCKKGNCQERAVRCSQAKPCPEGKACVKTYCKTPAPAPAGGAKKTRKRKMKKRTTRRHK